MLSCACSPKESNNSGSIAATTESSSNTTAPSETTQTEPEVDKDHLVYDTALEYVDFEIETDNEVYRKFAEEPVEGYFGDFYQTTVNLHKSIDRVVLSDVSLMSLQQKLDEVYYVIKEDGNEKYQQALAESKSVKEPSNNGIGFEFGYEWESSIYRSDSQCVTFVSSKHTRKYTQDDSKYGYEIETYNYNTDTAELITLNDVVKDKDAFYSYLLSKNDGEYWQGRMQEIKPLIDDNTLMFVLTYNSIILYLEDPEWHSYYTIDLPTLDYPEIYNMQYFGKTPSEYSVYNANMWDVDNDGSSDKISIEFDIATYSYCFDVKDTYSEISMYDTYHGTSVYRDDQEGGKYAINAWYFICIDSGRYIIVCGETGEGGTELEGVLLFKINDDFTVTFCEKYYGDVQYIYNPKSICVRVFSNLGGACGLTNNYVIENDLLVSDFTYMNHQITEAMKDITMYTLDGQPIVIEEGTTIRLTGFDEEFAYIDVYDSNYMVVDTVKMILDIHTGKFNGEPPTDLFKGCFYGG